jgi:tetratricopeptide (TPR) repeat protein
MSLFQKANELFRTGKLSEAIQAYHQVIEQHPDFAYAYHNLGEALAKQGELQAAIVAYQKAIELDNQSPWNYYQLSQVLAQQGLKSEAISAYQKAIEINPELRFNSGNRQEMFSPLSSVEIEHSINPAEAYHTIGEWLQNQGDVRNAIAFYQQSLQRQGNAIHLEFYRHLGEALLALAENSTNPEQYLHQMQQQVEQNLISWELYYCLGNAWQKLNQNKAIACYQQAIKLNPDAIPAYYKLIELQPHHPEIYQQLAAAFERQNQPNKAAIARLLATYPETQPPTE